MNYHYVQISHVLFTLFELREEYFDRLLSGMNYVRIDGRNLLEQLVKWKSFVEISAKSVENLVKASVMVAVVEEQ